MNRTMMILGKMDMAVFMQYGAVIGVLFSVNKEKMLKANGRFLGQKSVKWSKIE